jgi:RimJ/RimL family protein N-acetyltransferase
MDRQPILEGERPLLRPLVLDDWDALYVVASDRQLWARHPSHNRWQERVFRAFFDDALEKGGALAIIEKATGRLIGSSRFQNFDPADGGVVEIGWTFLARDRWGTGLNGEAKRLMLAHAFKSVERVVFSVGADNAISRRAMTKIGGRLTGETWLAERAGVPVEHVRFEITRADFERGPLNSSSRGA